MRNARQRALDTTRRSYVLRFPRDVDYNAVLAFIRAQGGIRPRKLVPFVASPTVTFEVGADNRGIFHRLAMPGYLADSVLSDLRAHIGGINVTPEERTPETWTAACELKMSNPNKPLAIPSPEGAVASLLAKLQPLTDGQKLMLQLVVTPNQPPRVKDDASKDEAEKLSHHTYIAAVRLAAAAESRHEADRLLNRLQGGLAALRRNGLNFERRFIPPSFVTDGITRRLSVYDVPCLLSAPELAVLCAFPVGTPQVPGLPAGRARHMPPDPRIPTTGLVMGVANFPGGERDLAVQAKDLTKHAQYCGASGSGKTTALENLMVQAMRQGSGLTFIDPHGDAITNLIDRVPPSRRDDVIVLDLTDSERPIGFNVLAGDPYMVTNQVMAVFDKLYDIYRMPQTADILRSTVLTLAQKELTLLDIPAILQPTENGNRLREELLRGLHDPALKDFWRQYNALKPERKNENIAPLLRRLRPFETWPSLRGCLGQTESGFSLEQVFAQKKILLVNLSKGRLGEEEAKLFGSLFVSKFWTAVQRRAALAVEQREPYFLFIDEFQNYVNLPVNFGDVLAEARKYGLCFVMAHQHLAQLPPALREAVMPNAGTKVIFQTSATDAGIFAREIPQAKPDDFQHLGQYEVVMRLSRDNEIMPPVTAQTLPPTPALGCSAAVQAASRAKYGTPLAEVEAALKTRQTARETPTKLPTIGRVEQS